MQEGLRAACRASWLFFVNAFGWTYRLRRVLPDGTVVPVIGNAAHVPFITWTVQDETAAEVIQAIRGGYGINGEKSRDMGFTWLVLSIFDWMFLFESEVNFGVVSRKEVLVDSAGDMDSLFEKVRYLHRMLPHWLCPTIRSRYMHLLNVTLGSTIAGESTNADVGRGGRKMAYFVDEAAVIQNALDVESALSQNTACQIWVSTPKGPLTGFHIRIKEGRGKRLQMSWYRHPEKSAGARQILDEQGRVRWTSPWYERQCVEYSRKTVAQEIDMDHGASGEMFFEFAELERHRKDHERDPLFRGELRPAQPMTEEEQVEYVRQMDPGRFFMLETPRGAWRFWIPLEDGRPPQHLSYVFGLDVSNGAGSSNAVLSVLARELNLVCAKFWSAHISPEGLAVLAATAGVWFGGVMPPAFIVWENNGPGGIFGRKLVKMGYPRYYRQRIDNTVKNEKTPRWGWHSNQARKEILLGMYRDSLSRDGIIQPCKESLDEAADYIYDDQGAIIPSRLRDEPAGGRMLHGDHVIADALLVLGRDEFRAQSDMPTRPPPGSFAWRREQRKRGKDSDNAWR